MEMSYMLVMDVDVCGVFFSLFIR